MYVNCNGFGPALALLMPIINVLDQNKLATLVYLLTCMYDLQQSKVHYRSKCKATIPSISGLTQIRTYLHGNWSWYNFVLKEISKTIQSRKVKLQRKILHFDINSDIRGSRNLLAKAHGSLAQSNGMLYHILKSKNEEVEKSKKGHFFFKNVHLIIWSCRVQPQLNNPT